MSGNIHTLGGGRPLGGDGDPEPLPAEWANRSSQPRIGRVGGTPTSRPPPSSSGRVATLRDFGSTPGASHGHRHPESDDEDGPQNFFAGGERSALSVENPVHGERRGAQGQVRDILRRAAEGSRAVASREAARSGPSWGAGHTLGSDESESKAISDQEPNPDTGETAIRNITFWRTGFTIENGPLRLYSDAESAELLESINQGLAPPEALNVQVGQPVELRVSRRLGEDYVPPPPGPFAGSGNRLGSPIPGGAPVTSSNPPPAPAPAQAAAPANPTPPVSFEVDLNAPTTSLQIRLADGTRLVARMNLTHTIADIRGFINASRPGTSSRPYAIQTTLPVKVLDDESQTVEAAGLKNSVVVQRFL